MDIFASSVQQVDAIYTDIQKTFDKVDNCILFAKLCTYRESSESLIILILFLFIKQLSNCKN